MNHTKLNLHFREHGVDGLRKKNAYNRFREISAFFVWSQKHKLSFTNPCSNVTVNYGHEMTKAITETQQRSLVKQWMDPGTNPQEALIGILALFMPVLLKKSLI
ncbi:MAG: hypothetical protein ACYDG6_05965 [Thermincolia bacterium]